MMKRFPIFLLFLILARTGFAQVAGTVLSDEEVRARGVENFFRIDTISDEIFQRMQRGGSFPKDCRTKRSDLRYLTLLHRNFQGETQVGELVCNKIIANDLQAIFHELYLQNYEIQRMTLIDDFGAEDERSMSANNTSGFCYRAIAGSTRLSKHAQGLAIDINPLQNPCVKYRDGRAVKIQPDTPEARKNAHRNGAKHQIDRKDLCLRLFRQHGFAWGGDWRTTKDYQHFEKK